MFGMPGLGKPTKVFPSLPEPDPAVIGFLELLEMDLENQLRDGGFRGVPQDDCYCPVSRWLFSKIQTPVSLCHESLYVFTSLNQDQGNTKRTYSLQSYPRIREFLLEFDNGDWPEFEDPYPELIGADH